MSEHMSQVERLTERLAAAGEQIERQRLALDDLREDNYRMQQILYTPVSLKDLRVAWEAAEQADECRKGDVLILRDPAEGYSVWRAGDADYLAGSTRILSRAPQREPWQDLADELDDTPSCIANEALAQRLHAQGWRKTGGGDDE